MHIRISMRESNSNATTTFLHQEVAKYTRSTWNRSSSVLIVSSFHFSLQQRKRDKLISDYTASSLQPQCSMQTIKIARNIIKYQTEYYRAHPICYNVIDLLFFEKENHYYNIHYLFSINKTCMCWHPIMGNSFGIDIVKSALNKRLKRFFPSIFVDKGKKDTKNH